MARVFQRETVSAGLVVPWVAADPAGDVVASGAVIGGWVLPVFLLARNNGALGPRDVSVNGSELTLQPDQVGVFPALGSRRELDDLVQVSYPDASNVQVAAIRLYDRSGIEV